LKIFTLTGAPQPLIEFGGPLNEYARDIIVFNDKIIIAGFMDNPDQYKEWTEKFDFIVDHNDPESTGQDIPSVGFMTVFDLKGNLVDNIVIEDSLSRFINALAKANDSDNFIVVGNAFGGDMWSAEYKYIQ